MTDRRRYSTALRAEQTQLARRRVLDAATSLFLEHGYLGTTLAQIAKAAEVSVQTVYNVVGGKAAVLKAAYDVLLAGDDEPVPIAERPTVRAMFAAADARSALAGYARHGRELSEQALPLVTMLYAQANTGDADLVDYVATIENERATGNRTIAELVANRFGLRPGLDVAAATDVVWALTAPDITDRLVHRRGWGWDRYEAWLATTLADALVGPA